MHLFQDNPENIYCLKSRLEQMSNDRLERQVGIRILHHDSPV